MPSCGRSTASSLLTSGCSSPTSFVDLDLPISQSRNEKPCTSTGLPSIRVNEPPTIVVFFLTDLINEREALVTNCVNRSLLVSFKTFWAGSFANRVRQNVLELVLQLFAKLFSEFQEAWSTTFVRGVSSKVAIVYLLK